MKETKIENMVLRTVYFDAAQDARLRTIAFHQRKTKNDLIREIVDDYLDAPATKEVEHRYITPPKARSRRPRSP